MSSNAKTSLITSADKFKTLKVSIDVENEGLEVGVYSLDAFLPAFHKVVDCDFAVEKIGASTGSATVSIGFDDLASEPDNLLNDEAIASFAALTSAAGAVVAGIPTLGTDATHFTTGIVDAQLAYEIKVAALTALKITAIITLVPTR
jgi:hypothetical protein